MQHGHVLEPKKSVNKLFVKNNDEESNKAESKFLRDKSEKKNNTKSIKKENKKSLNEKKSHKYED